MKGHDVCVSAESCSWHMFVTWTRLTVQNFEHVLEYARGVVDSSVERFRGGIEHGLQAVLPAALADGIDLTEQTMYDTLMAELQELIDQKLAALAPDDGDGRQPRKGSLAWYIRQSNEPVAPGSDLTVLQVCYALMFTKHFRGMNDVGMAEICGMMAVGGLFPLDNNMPKCAEIYAGVCCDAFGRHAQSVCGFVLMQVSVSCQGGFGYSECRHLHC